MKRLTFEGNFCDIAKCQEILCPYGKDCSQKRVWERLKAIEDVLGKEYDLDHFREVTKKLDAAENCAHYEDMEEQGRLLVLPPFKIGDTIYDIWEAKRNGTDEIRKIVITDIYAHIDKRRRVNFVINGFYFNPDDVGKTVFLTRELAEEALNEQKKL